MRIKRYLARWVKAGLICKISAFSLILSLGSAIAQDIKISSWNVHGLSAPGSPANTIPPGGVVRSQAEFERFQSYASNLRPDVLALQSIAQERTARLLLPGGYKFHFDKAASGVNTGFAIRGTIRFTANADFLFSGNPPVRAADITISFNQKSLRLLSVSLASGCENHTPSRNLPSPAACVLLTEQIRALAGWADRRTQERQPFAILGTFNREFVNDRSPESFLERPQMRRLTHGFTDSCWSSTSESRFLNHILVGGGAADFIVPNSFRVFVYGVTQSAAARLSPHCPISFTARNLQRGTSNSVPSDFPRVQTPRGNARVPRSSFPQTSLSFNCQDGLWITEVSGDGSLVLLSDGSIWSVDPIDTYISAIWLPTDSVIACNDKLVNSDDREVVSARKIR